MLNFQPYKNMKYIIVRPKTSFTKLVKPEHRLDKVSILL
ncbi:MAG: hypothetical protein Ct9H90mP3_4780 [Flammeovirgaceae bacterium]|nr:MAG: hypothetical protein Ct9H90mP3_4780 [Flammeovirgaceae bacterium]